MRLFTALSLPDPIARSLLLMQAGVPGARWQSRLQLHLTLRFIGEVDGARLREIDDALALIAAPGFLLELKGTGSFGGKRPRDVWAGVAANSALVHLNRKIESVLQRLGLPADERKFTPHVTLVRLKNAPPGAVADYLTDHALYASGPFAVASFALYSSQLSSDGSIYRVERDYPLQ